MIDWRRPFYEIPTTYKQWPNTYLSFRAKRGRRASGVSGIGLGKVKMHEKKKVPRHMTYRITVFVPPYFPRGKFWNLHILLIFFFKSKKMLIFFYFFTQNCGNFLLLFLFNPKIWRFSFSFFAKLKCTQTRSYFQFKEHKNNHNE